MRSRSLVWPALLALALAPTARADGADVLAGAFIVTGRDGARGYTGRLDVVAAAGDTYTLRGDVRFQGDPRTWRVSGSATAVTGGFRVQSTVTPTSPPVVPRAGAGVFRLSHDALGVSGALVGGRIGTESWRRVDRAGSVVLKVMTFNIKGNTVDWLKRQGRVARIIADERPDIVMLQEVPGQTRSHSYHVAALARLTGLRGTFRGHHRTGPLGLLTFGNGMLTRGEVTHADSIDLPTAPIAKAQRSALFCRVQVRAGVRINAFTTHLHHRNTPDDEAVREAQSVVLLRWMATFRERPMLVGGDFNARMASSTVALLTGRRAVQGTTGKLRDIWASANMPGTGATFGAANGPIRIDYLFWDPAPAAQLTGAPRDVADGDGVRVLRSWTKGDPTAPDAASDHRALVATIEVAR